MEKIVILAETGSDIPPKTAAEYGVHIVPMHVAFGEETKDDGSFPVEEIADYYARTKNLPKTSGCMPEDFKKAFQEIREAYPGCQILYLAYSSVTTCSYQSAQIVIEEEQLDYVTCVDTKHVSVGQYAVAIAVAKQMRAHPDWDIAQVADVARRISKQVRMAFVPDTLEFLRAGGRVSNGSALVGGLLKIHPRIEIQDGYLRATKKYRGDMKKIIPKLIRDYVEEQNLKTDAIYLVCAPGLSDEAKQAAEETVRSLGIQKMKWVSTGGVITCHGGPGAFGIVGHAKA